MTTTATHEALSEAKDQLLDAIDDVYNAVGIRLEGHSHARRTIAAAEHDFHAASARFGRALDDAGRDLRTR